MRRKRKPLPKKLKKSSSTKSNSEEVEIANADDEIVLEADKFRKKLVVFWKVSVFPNIMWGNVFKVAEGVVTIKCKDGTCFCVKPLYILPKGKAAQRLIDMIVDKCESFENEKKLLQFKTTTTINKLIEEIRNEQI